MAGDRWAAGDAYEAYVGRWSRRVAAVFAGEWMAAPGGGRWLDVGCGTGALAEQALEVGGASEVVGVDPSAGFLETARARLAGRPAAFVVGDAQQLPFGDGEFDVAVSGLVLNFVPDARAALAEQGRVARDGGLVGGYVWDYARGMHMMARFWEAAAALDPDLEEDHEAARHAIWDDDHLAHLAHEAGLRDARTLPIVVPTVFADFDDFWTPFLGGQGVAPSYLATLPEELRTAIRDRLRATLPIEPDGSIHLTARAWAFAATVEH